MFFYSLIPKVFSERNADSLSDSAELVGSLEYKLLFLVWGHKNC